MEIVLSGTIVISPDKTILYNGFIYGGEITQEQAVKALAIEWGIKILKADLRRVFEAEEKRND